MAQVPQKDGRDAQKSEAWHKSFFPFYFICFIFGCVGSWLRHTGSSLHHAGSFLVAHELRSSCDVGAPEHVGFVLVALRLRWPMACGILLPQVGIEPISPALEGGFFQCSSATAALGKSLGYPLLNIRPHSGITWRTEAHYWTSTAS